MNSSTTSKIRAWFKSKPVILLIVSLALYIPLHSMWEDLIDTTIVENYLSKFENNWPSDLLFLIISLECFLHRSKSNSLGNIVLLCFWGYYRFSPSQRFDFTSLYCVNHIKHIDIKYIDIFAVYSGCNLLCFITFIIDKLRSLELYKDVKKKIKDHLEKWGIKSSQTVPPFEFKDGFIRDSPIETDNKDLFGRKAHAKDSIEKILKTDTKESAFSFGIVAPWGAGKTSFLNLMREEIKAKKDCIIINFNPWLYDKTDITTQFFEELSAVLKEYDGRLANGLIDYAKALSPVETQETKIVSFFINLFSPSSDINDKIELIKDCIKCIKKKIVIFIDDIDRLDANEILEVLKLIRNTSNFPYMYFIVAYDKEYLLKCLEGKLPTKGSNYTEKIFEAEFTLPQPDKWIIKKKVFDNIYPHASDDKQKERLKTMFNIENTQYTTANDPQTSEIADKNVIIDNICTIRDINRITNAFRKSISNLKGNVDIYDLFLLEILKNKYPIVYSFFESNKNKILFTPYQPNRYELCRPKFENEVWDTYPQRPLQWINIKEHIKGNKSNLLIKESDVEKINNILDLLFPIGIPTDDSEMRINSVLHTDRYFRISLLEQDIPDSEFKEIIQKDIEKIKNKFIEWSQNRSISLLAKLKEHIAETKEEQKKHIRLILFSTSIILGEEDFNFITNQIMKLREFNKVSQFLEEDKKFIIESLCENGYNKNLALYLLNINPEDPYPLSEEELNEVRNTIFKDCIKKEENNIEEIFYGYRCTRYPHKVGEFTNYSPTPENKELMFKYIKNHLVDFIKLTIEKHEEIEEKEKIKYSINKDLMTWIENTWTWDEYETILRNTKKEKKEDKEFVSKIDEYMKFLGKWKAGGQKPIEFSFINLKI